MILLCLLLPLTQAWQHACAIPGTTAAPFIRRDLDVRSKVIARAQGTTGSVYDSVFLDAIRPFYSEATGTELMGPLVYSLFRSTRPRNTVELGAGYTTFWLAKAAQDAAEEASRQAADDLAGAAAWTLWTSDVGRGVVERAADEGTYSGTGSVPAQARKPYRPEFHCVDVFDAKAGSHYGDARSFETTLAKICGEPGPQTKFSWSLHATEWAKYRQSFDERNAIDLLWLDGFNRETFDMFWPLVNADGGMCVLHSTCNNHRNHAFIQVGCVCFRPFSVYHCLT
jgi:hypothetical protein